MSTDQVKKIVKNIQGVVTSNKMKDAIIVVTERKVKHPKYNKYIRRRTKVHARDAGNTASIGDVVVIQECRPMSKTISWQLVEIKETSQQI
jgi:small subunit ribosomal protein S17